MLGSAMLRVLSEDENLTVFGTVRSRSHLETLSEGSKARILSGVSAENFDSLVHVIAATQPDVVINCIGLVKQLASAEDPLQAIPINALLPHRILQVCKVRNARLIHISTDCVFSGQKGEYDEADLPDASDLYGRSKLMGEVISENSVTLRTSIIGHELSHGRRSLIGWFLAQEGMVKGYTRAVFSGLPTNELAHVVRKIVLPRQDLQGLYHVAAAPIDKYSLLRLVARTYRKSIDIEPDSNLAIDRSLSAEKFRRATGYKAPAWSQLIADMHKFNNAGSPHETPQANGDRDV